MMKHRLATILVLCLLFQAFFLPSQGQEEIIYEAEMGERFDWSVWKTLSGRWGIWHYGLHPIDYGLNILLLEKQLTGNWAIEMSILWSSSILWWPDDPYLPLAWWQDIDNYIGLEFDHGRKGFRWVGMINGRPIRSEPTPAAMGKMVRVRIEKRGMSSSLPSISPIALNGVPLSPLRQEE